MVNSANLSAVVSFKAYVHQYLNDHCFSEVIRSSCSNQEILAIQYGLFENEPEVQTGILQLVSRELLELADWDLIVSAFVQEVVDHGDISSRVTISITTYQPSELHLILEITRLAGWLTYAARQFQSECDAVCESIRSAFNIASLVAICELRSEPPPLSSISAIDNFAEVVGTDAAFLIPREREMSRFTPGSPTIKQIRRGRSTCSTQPAKLLVVLLSVMSSLGVLLGIFYYFLRPGNAPDVSAKFEPQMRAALLLWQSHKTIQSEQVLQTMIRDHAGTELRLRALLSASQTYLAMRNFDQASRYARQVLADSARCQSCRFIGSDVVAAGQILQSIDRRPQQRSKG